MVIFDIKRSLSVKRGFFLCFRFPLASVRNLFGVESWTCSRKYVCYFGCAKTITSAWHNRFLGMKRSLHRHETLVGLFLLVFRADDVPQFHLVADLLFCDPSQASGDFGAVLFHTEQIGGGDVRSIDFYILY